MNRELGADPQEKMLHLLGFWSLVYLLLGLSITPLAKLCRAFNLIRFRRMIGLYAAFYLLLHMLIFFVFYLDSEFQQLLTEVIDRPYITLGMLAFVLMLPLVFTSTKLMQRRLGPRWKILHRLVYPISVFAIVHFIWQSKSDLNEPLTYTLWLVLLLGLRVYWAKSKNI